MLTQLAPFLPVTDLDMTDVDAAHTQMAPALNALPQGRARETFGRHHGQRALHVLGEDGTLPMLGAAMATGAAP